MPFKLGGEIPKGHVKLPEPLTSDYLQANTATASSEGTITLPVDLSTATFNYSGLASTTFLDTSTAADKALIHTGPVNVSNEGYVSISLSLDVTNKETLTFEYYGEGVNNDHILSSGIDLKLYIDESDSGLSLTPDGAAHSASLDVSGLTGEHTFEWRLINNTGDTINGGNNDTLLLIVQNVAAEGSAAAGFVLDEDNSTYWQPSTSNAGEYIYLDLGTPTILGGARIHWLDAVPNAYRLQASLDATNWTDVYTATSTPTANDWTEYSWYATYARYLRLYLDDQGTTPVKVAVFDYYSHITDRVAAEHGHGSGVEKWKKGRKAKRGFHKKEKLKKKISQKKKKNKLSKQDILELVEELLEYVDFKVPD